MRLPRRAGDTRRIDIWLAPSLGWLPVRMVQTEPNGAQIELLLHRRTNANGDADVHSDTSANTDAGANADGGAAPPPPPATPDRAPEDPQQPGK